MSAVAYPFECDAPTLAALLAHVQDRLQFVIRERFSDIEFRTVTAPPEGVEFGAEFPFGTWRKGRAFGETIEVRWRASGSRFRVLVVSDAEISLNEIASTPEHVALEAVGSLEVALWGESQTPGGEPDLPEDGRAYWYEQQVPRFLAYPWPGRAPAPKRCAIRVNAYRVTTTGCESDPKGEVVQDPDTLYRFAALLPFRGEAPDTRETEDDE